MRVAITGDFQTDFGNLPLCKKIWKFLLSLAAKNGLEAIVLTGDLKQQYNPVDVRVIKFWMRAIAQAKKNGLRVVVLLGNHDRVGLYTDAQNWLSILRKAGAEVFDKPDVCELSNGKIGMLPFTTSTKLLRQRALDLSKLQWNKHSDILLFHSDIRGCQYNQLGEKSEAKLKLNELYSEKYLACFGGHIHLPQLLGRNVFYVGSPFSMDWGEANQRKRIILVLGSDIRSIDSPVEGWFDSAVPGFYNPKTWDGCHLRFHIECGSRRNYSKILERARLHLEREYPNAIIKLVPKFEDKKEDRVEGLDPLSSDSRKIKTYVAKTIPEPLARRREQVIAFLLAKLNEAEGLRRYGKYGLKFKSAEGKNVLSFEDVFIDFERQGLVVIEGINKDWNGQSNGSGKTNFTQLLPVSLFGATFKGQKHDKWARRHTKDKAVLTLKVEDGSDNKIEVIRGRRPTRIQLMVNGEDASTGMNRSSKDGTQAAIESVTGFTWQTLANAVFIDQTITNAFLTGRRSERTALLSRFQNLERFDRALSLVRKYKQRHQTSLEQTTQALDIIRTRIEDAREYLEKAKKESVDRLKPLQKEYRSKLHSWRELHREKLILEKRERKIRRKYEPRYKKLAEKVVAIGERIEAMQPVVWEAERTIQKHENISGKSTCPTCGAAIDNRAHQSKMDDVAKLLRKASKELAELKENKREYDNKCALVEGTIDKATVQYAEARDKADNDKHKLRWLKTQIAELKNSERVSVKDSEKKLKGLKEELIEFKEYLQQIEKDEEFISYCENAFSRDGIPSFLNAQLCPLLNKASDYYADLFFDKEITVRFEVEDGELEPRVINAHGGDLFMDQSDGEAGAAGLIASFALKEIAPKTNVLILDEPAKGLSSQNIIKFAKGLLKIKHKFESIFVVTHSPILLGALANQKVIQVVKHNRISRVKGK